MIESERFSGIEISLIRQVMNSAPSGAVNMALGELGYPMPAILREEAHRLLDSGTAVYTPNAGLTEAREAVAHYLDAEFTHNNVCITNGAEEAIFLSLFALSNPGDIIAIPDPDYTAYPAIAKLLGLQTIPLNYESDLDAVDWQNWELILSQKVRFLLLSNPQNPSGSFFNINELNILAAICNKYKITVLIDEIYRNLWFQEEPAKTTRLFERSVHLGGLSKSHCLSGWRIGWAVSAPEIIAVITKAKQYVSTCSNWLSQKLIPAALSVPGMIAADEIRLRLSEDRELLRAELARVLPPEYTHLPHATPYAMLRAEDDLKTAQILSGKGVICVPGRAFGEVSRGWIRVNYAIPREGLLRGLEIIKGLYTEVFQ